MAPASTQAATIDKPLVCSTPPGKAPSPKEGGGGERWRPANPADEVPAQREGAVHQHGGRNAQHVIVGDGGQRDQRNERGDDDESPHWKPRCPMIPVGRNISSKINSVNEMVTEYSGPKNRAE